MKRVEGVEEATFSYERSEGLVTYDPEQTNPRAIIEELERMTGFLGVVRGDEDDEEGEHQRQ